MDVLDALIGDCLATNIIDFHFTQLKLPLFFVSGISHRKTIKFFRKISSITVVLMVDSKTSHCLVLGKLIQQLVLLTSPTILFRVKLGDGRCLHSFGICHSLQIDLYPITISPTVVYFCWGYWLTAISVKRYRYSLQPKDEMERLVPDMLATGIIRHSSSTFSYPLFGSSK